MSLALDDGHPIVCKEELTGCEISNLIFKRIGLSKPTNQRRIPVFGKDRAEPGVPGVMKKI
jgi:hypothetical protein